MVKNILVTGANRGIGLEIVCQLAHKGHSVILTARSRESGISAVETLGEKGFTVDFIELDVASTSSIEKMESTFKERYGHLDVLINNAGVLTGTMDTVDIADSDVRKVFDVNVFGLLNVSKKLIPHLKKSNDPRIIHLSSEMGQIDGLLRGGYAAYRLSKFAVNGLTMLMSADLKTHNIRVNAVHPGWVKTDMGGPDAVRSVEEGAVGAVWLATAEEIPNGRLIRDREIRPW